MLVVCALMVPSCAKRQQKKQNILVDAQEIERQRSVILDKIAQQEAMLVTVPIPLYDERIIPSSLDSFEHETIVLGYKSPLTFQQAHDFFMSQMERYGWKHIVTFDADSSFLLFENPDTHVCVTLHCAGWGGLTIFIYIKRANF